MVTRQRIGLATAALGVAAVGTFVATGIGGGGGYGSADAETTLTAHRVVAPGGASAKALAEASATKLIYKETPLETIDQGTEFVEVGRCPRRSGIVDGYYGRDDVDPESPFLVIDHGGAPTPNLRKWQFAIENTDTVDAGVFFGIICVKP